MSEAVRKLRQAIRLQIPIAVYGDFDADGVTATALLTQTLAALGARVEPYIPRRVEEGYGLNLNALRQLYRRGIRVVVTVDCGIRSCTEVEQVGRHMDILITDHHSVGPHLPPALAIINPKQPGCPYPFKHLAGVGVAFKLAQALLQAESAALGRSRKSKPPLNETDLLDLVALGTVADLVPLLGENRTLVRSGLRELNPLDKLSPEERKRLGPTEQDIWPRRVGLRHLIQQARLRPNTITATAIAFMLGPRINAAGRLGTAEPSYRLLTTDREEEAAALAVELEGINRERQRLTEETFALAQAQIADRLDDPILFAQSPEFKAGIVGLVAGRITETYYRPSVVIEIGQRESRGSCRSIDEFDITAALDQCADLLERYGGHARAAGFTIRNENLEALLDRLRGIACDQLASVDLTPKLMIDAEVPLSEINWATFRLLRQLEPCGTDNPTPLLLSRGVEVRRVQTVGEQGQHLKLTLKEGRLIWDAIGFNLGHRATGLPERIDIVYTLERSWNDEPRLQLFLQDLAPGNQLKT